MDAGYDVYEYSRKGLVHDLRESLRGGSKPDDYMAYDGSTALIMAARGGHQPVVEELIKAGASLDVRTDEGSTLLHHAVSGKSSATVKAVLAARVNVDECNEDGVSPLMLAAHYAEVGVIEVLLDAGADVNLIAEGWGNALDGAQGEAIEFLEKRGAQRMVVKKGGLEDQPVAAAAERFCYGCFESGEDPGGKSGGNNGYKPGTVSVVSVNISKKAKVGDRVKLAKPKLGKLSDGEVGIVIEDDGSDCLPLKVKAGDGHDFYNYEDLEVCGVAVELPPDSDRATPEGTQRFIESRRCTAGKGHFTSVALGKTGLTISPVGFGCHRLCDEELHKTALSLAAQIGCNLFDLAPNYTDGEAETVAGAQLEELINKGKLRRDEIVIMSKVGNVLGKQLKFAEGVPNMARINDNLSHCIAPEWIEQEITRSLQRLRIKCIDCLLLHCPEFEMKSGVDIDEIYARLKAAFKHLEGEVSRGRIAMYGISAAFYPLRPSDPEHLHLDRVMQQLPADHHFRVIQFPLNFAECQVLTVGHTPRSPDGVALDRELGVSSPTLFEAAQAHGLATLTNRPLDGIYKESHGVLRFSSLDCDVRSFSELQLDNCDSLEEKVTSICRLDEAPYRTGEGASGELAEKSIKVLSGLEGVDCVLVGMRQPQYVMNTLGLALFSPPVPSDVAAKATSAIHNTVNMWFATAIHEADHGTAKDWRLPERPQDVQNHMNQSAL